MKDLKESASLLGIIMENAVKMNQHEDVDVYFCLQGNTGCACLTVEENKTQVYQRREFITNTEGIRGIFCDIYRMRRAKEAGE